MARKKRHTARVKHRRATSRTPFFRTRLFYFLGLTVLALFVIGQYAKTRVSPNVLGESSGGGSESRGGGGDSSGGGSSGGSDSSGGSSATTQTQQVQQNTKDSSTEIRTGGTEIKTKVEENGRIKVESVQPGFKFKLEDNAAKMRIEDARGRELGENEQEELENELETEGVEVSTEDGKFAIMKNNIKAVSELPLSVDTSKTQILITTPNGKTVPVILPNVAIENLARVGFLTASASGQQTGSPSSSLTLSTNQNGIPVYLVPAFKNARFLGLFSVQVPVTTEVSAQTGAVMGTRQDFFSQLLGTFSF